MDKGGLLTGTSWLKKKKFQQKKQSRKIVLKRRESRLFETEIWQKQPLFGTKLGQ